MQESYPNVRDGRKTVAIAGTAERLVSSNTPCRRVEITALPGNSDTVVIGNSTVVAAEATRRGMPVQPTQTVTLEVEDLYALYIDAMVNGEGVSYAYFF
jgi:hypothetical protein